MIQYKMKKIILVCLLLWGCNNEPFCPSLQPPYGPPDEIYYQDLPPYETTKYIYYDVDGKYIESTWERYGIRCWEQSSLIIVPAVK